MAASFLIYYPDVPLQALVTTTTAAYDADYPVGSLATGRRANYGQLQAAGTATQITYDLGTGNARTLDHFLLAGVQALRANSTSQARVQGSSNGTTWVDQLGTASGFGSSVAYGPDNRDVLFRQGLNDTLGATLAAYRYFRVILGSAGAQTFAVSKVMLGAAFDMGKEPDNYDLSVVPESEETWTYPRGQVLMAKSGPARHMVTVEWDGVPDATAQAFDAAILKPAARDTVFLSTAVYLDPLYDNRLMHVRLDASQTSISRKRGAGDWNDIKAVFVEEA